MIIMDIITIIIAIIPIIISIIGVVISCEANKYSRKVLVDSQKGCMPLVRFKGNILVNNKTFRALRNENTFDFDEVVLRLNDEYNGGFYDEDDEFPCITAEIENCGNGVINEMTINGFFVQSGNKFSIDSRSQEELYTLCINNKECKEQFVLLPNESTIINFVIEEDIIKRNDCESKEELLECMRKFERDNNNIMVGMNLKMESLNNTSYNQDYLAGTYLDGEIVHNSFCKLNND